MVSMTWTSKESDSDDGSRTFPLDYIEQYSHQFYLLEKRLGKERIQEVKKKLDDICDDNKTPYLQMLFTLGGAARDLHASLQQACNEFNQQDHEKGVKWTLVSMGMEKFDEKAWFLPKCWGACTGAQPIFFVKIDILPADLLQENTGSKRNLIITAKLSSEQAPRIAPTRTAPTTTTPKGTTRASEIRVNQNPLDPSDVSCPSCSIKVHENAKFCHDCGHNLSIALSN